MLNLQIYVSLTVVKDLKPHRTTSYLFLTSICFIIGLKHTPWRFLHPWQKNFHVFFISKYKLSGAFQGAMQAATLLYL